MILLGNPSLLGRLLETKLFHLHALMNGGLQFGALRPRLS